MQSKKDLYQIGEVARLFHLSISLLRHYDKTGLVTPEYTDPDTGYRYYSCLLYTSPSPRDRQKSRMPSSA